MWYGYTPTYAYSGSSSPQTGWLPSYPLGEGSKPKVALDKIALKGMATDIGMYEDIGCVNPTRFDNTMHSKVVLESSNWFLE